MSKIVVGARVTYIAADEDNNIEAQRGTVMAVRQPVRGSVKIDVILDSGVTISGWDGQ